MDTCNVSSRTCGRLWNSSYRLLYFQYLRQILSSNAEGKAFQAEYMNGAENTLDKKGRNKIAALVIQFELNKDPDWKATNLLERAQDIKALFPNERVSTYYIPYLKYGNDKATAKGKLVHTYYNKRRNYLKAGLLDKNRSRSTTPVCFRSYTTTGITDNGSEEDDERIEEALMYLRTHADQWELIEIDWEKTAKKRLKEITSADGPTIQAYMDEFPPLRRNNGYLLVSSTYLYIITRNS